MLKIYINNVMAHIGVCRTDLTSSNASKTAICCKTQSKFA